MVNNDKFISLQTAIEEATKGCPEFRAQAIESFVSKGMDPSTEDGTPWVELLHELAQNYIAIQIAQDTANAHMLKINQDIQKLNSVLINFTESIRALALKLQANSLLHNMPTVNRSDMN